MIMKIRTAIASAALAAASLGGLAAAAPAQASSKPLDLPFSQLVQHQTSCPSVAHWVATATTMSVTVNTDPCGIQWRAEIRCTQKSRGGTQNYSVLGATRTTGGNSSVACGGGNNPGYAYWWGYQDFNPWQNHQLR
jgi:hypothetical protein